jgi:tetratricopeptide (TPR) repeat protein
MKDESIASFKFKYVKNGKAVGMRSAKGFISKTSLWLGEQEVPYEYIGDATTRDKRLIIALTSDAKLSKQLQKNLLDGHVIALEIDKLDALELEKQIDRHSSTIHAELSKQQYIDKGQEDLFKAIICPNCQATVDLSELPETPYIYCRFCESILDQETEIITNGDNYRCCDECGLFDYVQGYTDFQFYFFIVVFGYTSRRRYLCSVDAVRMARRNLLKNLIFLLGVPSAIRTWIQASRVHEKAFQGLRQANSFAQKGNYRDADKLYSQLLTQHPNHPGILMNQGWAHFSGGDVRGCVEYLKQSLEACCNYLPSIRMAKRLQNTMASVPT